MFVLQSIDNPSYAEIKDVCAAAGLTLGVEVRFYLSHFWGARCSSVVRAFARGAMGRQIDPSWGEPTELFNY